MTAHVNLTTEKAYPPECGLRGSSTCNLLREKSLSQRLARGSGTLGGHVRMFKWDGSVGSRAGGSDARGPLSTMAFVLPGQDSSLWPAADMDIGCPAVPRLLAVDTDSLNPNISPP